MARTKTNRIVVYKLKQTFEFELIDQEIASHGFHLEKGDETMKLFLKLNNQKTPQWAQYLNPMLKQGTEILNSNASFVLITKSGDQLFALAGGHGFHTLKNICEDDFGLRVAVRLISEEGIAALQQKPLKGSTKQVLRSVSSYDPSTDPENYNRLLKFVEGEGEFEGRSFKVGGRSSLTLRTARSVNNLSDVIEEIKEVLNREERVKLPKSYKIVSDLAIIEALEASLMDKFEDFWLGNADRDSMYLEFDDPIAQTRAVEFKVSCGNATIRLEDFDLVLLRDGLLAKGITNFKRVLERGHITAYDEDTNPLTEVRRFMDALTYDCQHGGKVYLKQGKLWLEVLEDIRTHVEEKISDLSVDFDYLPNWTCDISRERDYNERVAADKSWGFLDADFVQIEGRSKIELCDMYDPEMKRFIHVKKTWGSQSSYLFLQAATAAETYYEDSSVRQKCAEKWGDYFDGSFDDSSTIVIGVAAKENQLESFPSSMTYFAKLNLYNAVRTIRSSGFKVCLAPILLEEAE